MRPKATLVACLWLSSCVPVAQEVIRYEAVREIARQEVAKGEDRERDRTGYRAAVLLNKSWVASGVCSEETRSMTNDRCEADGKILDGYETARDRNPRGEPVCLVTYSCVIDRRPIVSKPVEEKEEKPPRPSRAVFRPEDDSMPEGDAP